VVHFCPSRGISCHLGISHSSWHSSLTSRPVYPTGQLDIHAGCLRGSSHSVAQFCGFCLLSCLLNPSTYVFYHQGPWEWSPAPSLPQSSLTTLESDLLCCSLPSHPSVVPDRSSASPPVCSMISTVTFYPLLFDASLQGRMAPALLDFHFYEPIFAPWCL
jgi:hypothetical protein